MTPTQPTATTTEVSEAAKALVEKLHLIHADPAFQSVWTLSHLHCGPYTGQQYADELAALEAALSTAPSGDGVPGMVQTREVLFFASYCGNDNTACSEARPCPACLGMSNVYRIPADAKIEYVRELSPDWLGNKHLDKLTARQIGKAPKALDAALSQRGAEK
ncbi:hypothetical protein [Mesorhizobium sp. URHB0026]